uniref:AIG1-type G domain-containing protein n=1 Tax=Astatotilapia calliptera TaxID=8154 RepID=A0AAX7VRB9_ASTCA
MAARASQFRIVIFGKNDNEKTALSNFITGKKNPIRLTAKKSIVQGEWRKIPVTVAKTTDLFSLPVKKVKLEMKMCVARCPPGPNVLLLVLNPSDFTEDDRRTLKSILCLFGGDAFNYSMVITTQKGEAKNTAIDHFIQNCRKMHYTLDFDKKDFCDSDRETLMGEMEKIVAYNRGGHLNFTETADLVEEPQEESGHGTEEPQIPNLNSSLNLELYDRPRVDKENLQSPRLIPPLNPEQNENPQASTEVPQSQKLKPLNLVLFGRFRVGKTSAANAILGERKVESESSQCIKNEAAVCGRLVSLVELPALCGKPQEETKKEAFKSISLCDPEGVHAFILVQPLDPPTSEDKKEVGRFTEEEKKTVELIQNFFGKNSNDFIIILFTRGDDLKNQTVESYIEEDSEGFLKKLTADCGGRYHVFNNNDRSNRSQVSQLLTKIESMVKKNGGGYYTSEMFKEAEAAIQKEMQKIMKKKEEEIERQKKDLEKEHEKKLQEAQLKIQQERAAREKALQEKEELIKKEEEEKKRMEEKRAEEEKERKRREEIQQQQWVQKEKEIKSKPEEATYANQRNEEIQKEIEAWENEQKEWEKKRLREEQLRLNEQARLEKLRAEYEQEKKEHECRRKEEDRLRKEQEEKEWRELQQNLEKQVEEMRRKNQEEARKQAEEFNEFRQRYTTDFAVVVAKHEREVENMKLKQQKTNDLMIQQLRRNKAYQKDFDLMKMRQEEEMSELKRYSPEPKQIDELQKAHDEEINEWIQEHVRKATEKNCSIL